MQNFIDKINKNLKVVNGFFNLENFTAKEIFRYKFFSKIIKTVSQLKL